MSLILVEGFRSAKPGPLFSLLWSCGPSVLGPWVQHGRSNGCRSRRHAVAVLDLYGGEDPGACTEASGSGTDGTLGCVDDLSKETEEAVAPEDGTDQDR